MQRKRALPVFALSLFALLTPVAARAAATALAPGIQLFEGRRYEEARKFFEPYVAKNPRDAEAVSYLGRTWFFLNDYEKAADWMEKAAALQPASSDVQLWLGRSYGRLTIEASLFSKAGLAKKAKAAFDQAVVLDPNNLDARSDLLQYYLQAPGIMGGSVDKAKEQAAEIRKRDATRGVLASVSVRLHEKDAAGAEREVTEAIQKAPAEPRLRLALAALYQSQEKWDAAFEAAEAVLKADSDNWDALYAIGRIGALSGKRLDRAEECLKRYLGHTPGPESAPLANAHFRLGQVYQKKGNKAAARAAYQEALKLDPRLEDAKKALASLG
jgi:tetratricopeptide (TPR) repeat protein